MFVVELPKKLYVNVKDCGSKFIGKISGNVLDYNTCYWNCLGTFLGEKGLLVENDLNKIKKETTSNLPFGGVFGAEQDPSKIGSCADSRVILKTTELYMFNIYLITSGSHIYKFGSFNDKENEPMFILLNNNHYQLVTDDISKDKMLKCLEKPSYALTLAPEKGKKSRRKRGKGKESLEDDSFKSAAKNSNSKYRSKFEEIASVQRNLTDFFDKSVKRKRGKRGKR